MKKASLQDIKRNNRILLIRSLIEEVNLSRIEISHSTGLSPSTVTTLVSELLEDNVLVETGREVSTGGRRRKELSINPGYGVITVIEAGQAGASIHFFDILLHKLGEKTLATGYVSGNILLTAATSTIFEFFGAEDIRQGHLAGIGLLFQDDMRESEYSVMFSTSLSSDIISLREALYSQFQAPVLEEYSMNYSITDALTAAAGKSAVKNSAHISVAGSVLASVTIGGKPLPMKNGKSADFTGIVQEFDGMLSGAGETGAAPCQGLAGRIAALIALLCTMFSLDEVFLSGHRARASGFLQTVNGALGKIMPGRPPTIRTIKPPQDEFANRLADKIRKRILLT